MNVIFFFKLLCSIHIALVVVVKRNIEKKAKNILKNCCEKINKTTLETPLPSETHTERKSLSNDWTDVYAIYNLPGVTKKCNSYVL